MIFSCSFRAMCGFWSSLGNSFELRAASYDYELRAIAHGKRLLVARSTELEADVLFKMKISPHWLRDFIDIPVDYTRLADELTLAGIAVEGISGTGDNTVFEMEITTNRPDAMNHYGVARKLSTEDLVVADAHKPVGLAGVICGNDTATTEKTKNILIESAWWDP